ncbi:roadblock/LC7 domain-containing protein [Arenicella xantha]|uniref:Putative regulator of Ras-like GTPase activity (Roadblock/LC7/MglB family) n=1 Tax=Arenicella xantha TaxID=644221 RepID=A0A395JNE1_9GAMM|nr:hypothetical protein [Arenicella xantha]RBP49594.1 putative regulator of Ras-like GTPase activity (Roadblock/LC7/MglB family) [Arenicella xantha]
MPNNQVPVKPELISEIRTLCETNKEIFVVSLCTTDGFSIKSFASKSLAAEADKLAAMSSTICALSDATSNQVLTDQFDVTIVESKSGNVLFVRTQYLDKPCVLMIAARSEMALANVRYRTIKLAESIASIAA